ncbi:MAG: Xaa-Pro aminopeptidase [Myxococcota bacterium]
MDPFVARRARLLTSIEGVAIVPSAPVTIRNHDVEHPYRQDSDFYYLTGFEEPESGLLLSTVHEEHRAVLFVRPRDREKETWDGSRVGVEGAVERFGVDAAFPIGELAKRLPRYLKGADQLHFHLGRQARLDQTILEAIERTRERGRNPRGWPQRIVHPELSWHEMRLFKDAGELDTMRRAAEITAESHLRAMVATKPGMYEYEVESVLRDTFLKRGARRVAYGPIVGSGPNACVLHYRDNDRRMKDGELLLIDAGCEYRYYASDVTRTFPVNGSFSPPQRAVYEVVLEAQRRAIEACKPGTTIKGIHDVTVQALTEGMVEIGLLEGDVDALLKEETYKRYALHRTSHWLGLDVHDVGLYFKQGESRAVAPGLVFTIEPGLYIREDDEEAPERFRGIGVRIEDDILITKGGYEVLTEGVPKAPDEVERACRS